MAVQCNCHNMISFDQQDSLSIRVEKLKEEKKKREKKKKKNLFVFFK